MAKLHFKYGAMNSGKTDILIKTAYNYTERGLGVVIIKPAVDTKGGDNIVARAGNARKVDILAYSDTNLEKTIKNLTNKPNCVLVDEAQLLSPRQINQLHNVAKIQKISVIAHGLRTDFKTNLFPASARLLALADNIEKLPTMCACGSQAEFNCRKQNGVFVFTGSLIAIDGEDDISYDSLCGTCYANAKKHNK